MEGIRYDRRSMQERGLQAVDKRWIVDPCQPKRMEKKSPRAGHGGAHISYNGVKLRVERFQAQLMENVGL